MGVMPCWVYFTSCVIAKKKKKKQVALVSYFFGKRILFSMYFTLAIWDNMLIFKIFWIQD